MARGRMSPGLRTRGGFISPRVNPGGLTRKAIVTYNKVNKFLNSPEGVAAKQFATNRLPRLAAGAKRITDAATSIYPYVSKLKDVQNVVQFMNKKKKEPMSIYQDIKQGQGTTQSFAQLGKYRAASTRVRAKVLSERRGFLNGFATSNPGSQGVLSVVENMSATALKALYSAVPGAISGYNGYMEPISQVNKLYLTNYDVGNVILYLYDYVARRDTNINPATAAQDINNPGVGQSFGISSPGTTLFDCTMFTNLFKIWKVTRVELRPGQSHIHLSKVYHTRKLNGKDFLSDTDVVTNEFVRGVTTGVFCLTQSLPVVDSNATEANLIDDVVTFGSARVAYVNNYVHSLYAYPNQNVQQTSVNAPATGILSQVTRQNDGTMVGGENLASDIT